MEQRGGGGGWGILKGLEKRDGKTRGEGSVKDGGGEVRGRLHLQAAEGGGCGWLVGVGGAGG